MLFSNGIWFNRRLKLSIYFFQTERATINPEPNKIAVRAHSKVYNKFKI